MSYRTTGHILHRTWASLLDVWEDLTGSEQALSSSNTLNKRSLDRLQNRIEDCLAGKGGEVSARGRAARLGEDYLQLNEKGRLLFLTLLAEKFGPRRENAEKAIADYQNIELDDDPESLLKAEINLRRALSPPRKDLLTQFNALPQGIKFLVDLRADLLTFLKKNSSLLALDHDLQDLLASWFDVGFLELRSVTWDSPASLLEKFMAYEAVHEISSWDDLRNRLDSDRKLYAFFHPRMPTEPLIFVEVALVNGISEKIHGLLDQDAPVINPEEADTAIFYSISNTQKGLRGISFGNFLIKKVVSDLTDHFPNLKTFSTLSPIPGFMGWLKNNDEVMFETFSNQGWMNDAEKSAELSITLKSLAAQYLVIEKSRNRPLDPVARFHLTNGARIERINCHADLSEKGLEQSAGMMVNYLYDLKHIEKNHEYLMRDGTIAIASSIKSLLPKT